MQNSTQPTQLDQLVADLKADSLLDQALTALPFDPFSIYCSVTGAPIGTLSDDESRDLWDAAFARANGDFESILDELRMACFAFCRPSPAFGMATKDTLTRLSRIRPAHVWSYLVNRWADHPNQSKVDFESRLLLTQSRVLNWKALHAVDSEAWASHDSQMCLLELLQLDSFANLATLDSPDFLPLLLAGPSKELRARLELYSAALHESVRKANRYVTGNPVSAPLYREMFTNLTPTKAEQKRQEEKAKMGDFLSLLTQAVSEPTQGAATPTPAAPVVRKVRMGLKLGANFAKKES